MQFGNQKALAFQLEPVEPSWARVAPADRGPWAYFRLWIGGKNLTRNVLPGSAELREGVYVPLAPLADWLVAQAPAIAYEESAKAFPTDVNLHVAEARWRFSTPARGYTEDRWDDERFSWTDRHFIAAGSDGAWLPNLALVHVERTLWASWSRPRFGSRDGPQFVEAEGCAGVPWPHASRAIAEFVDYVGGELRGRGLAERYPWCSRPGAFEAAMELSWDDAAIDLVVRSPVARVLEVLGAGDASELPQRLGLGPGADPLDSAAVRAMRDLALDEGIGEVLVEGEQTARCPSASNRLFDVRDRLLPTLSGLSAEEQGDQAAEALRSEFGLADRPLDGSFGGIPYRLDVRVEDHPVETLHDHSIVAGGRRAGSLVAILSAPRMRRSWARRMEVLRGLGHLLLDDESPSGIVGAGSSARTAGFRRRRSGAFAAAVALPRAALLERSGGVLDAAATPATFEGLMVDYGVGASTAAWRLYNAGLLSDRRIAEELIEEYGSREAAAAAA
jgi:hypothetical protein